MDVHHDAVRQFDAEHEGQDGFVVYEGWVFYSDGAKRVRSTMSQYGLELRMPPTDVKALLKAQRFFWETKLQDLVDQFSAIRSQACERFNLGLTTSAQTTEKLRLMQTEIRRARGKLNHLAVQERGYTQADVDRCWDCWQEFMQASRDESQARQKYESALLGKSSPGVLEKLKLAFDRAKERSKRAMDAWNDFRPVQARDVVSAELDQRRRQEAYDEMTAIEV